MNEGKMAKRSKSLEKPEIVLPNAAGVLMMLPLLPHMVI
jgi:hypothetical protein